MDMNNKEIKNGDMPANCVGLTESGPWTAHDLGNGYSEQCRPAFGLTKREMVAMHVLANISTVGSYGEYVKTKCKAAVEYADALLAELGENK
jgi:hypothetical protein